MPSGKPSGGFTLMLSAEDRNLFCQQVAPWVIPEMAYKIHTSEQSVTCTTCGSVFTSNKKNSKTCSVECRKEAKRKYDLHEGKAKLLAARKERRKTDEAYRLADCEKSRLGRLKRAELKKSTT